MESLDRRSSRAHRTPRVTAAMVAARAGVSTATVSLVANGKTQGRVSDDNISRVRTAIAELGYVVDSIGSSLARGVSSIVILVTPDVSNPFFANVIAGVRESLGAEYQLLLSVTDAGESPQASDVQKLLALRPAGLLVGAPSAEFLEDLSAAGPLVLLDAPGLESYAPSVNLDVAQGARELARHLAASGHTRAAYVDGITGTATFQLRREAFLEEAAACGLVVDAGHVISTAIDVGAAAAAFAAAWPVWEREGVTAVVCGTDTHAYGVLQEARVEGVAIPGKLAVAGFDDLPYSATSNPSLTTVHLPARPLGRRAGEQLRGLMEGVALKEPHVTLESSLVVRGSTA
ncbi:LacI family DNA-binding transcriptional regulator [Paenarthrobacter nicotinovorans]|uniref:LacI family DNA-binding transcriptional regulator n=2 Tax=Paenarthrobacter nicotinovorans TaxID=29320 RepID=UPI00166EAA58|nr:LacI family DNA-binding transcriptional regulator [Paenarthrobacter nicotinovorans]MBP2395091.1 DNA-binding LacI/PurR family transcriptional regulator [Paenarthrobacter nicotinovorans]UKE98756.1 LacI family transcriptional regulator [Paenarthrobacter nicotinovorans]UKF03545.1 LacI family transcriptional regulator [Paenarthrobacter nicotinovorans]